MQFCCVNCSGENRVSFVLKRFVMLLMLSVFAAAPVLDLLHVHEAETVSGVHEQERIGSAHLKCHFCHHFAQHHPVPLIEIATLSLLYFESFDLRLRPAPAHRLLDLPGISWTNKGPPSLFA